MDDSNGRKPGITLADMGHAVKPRREIAVVGWTATIMIICPCGGPVVIPVLPGKAIMLSACAACGKAWGVKGMHSEFVDDQGVNFSCSFTIKEPNIVQPAPGGVIPILRGK